MAYTLKTNIADKTNYGNKRSVSNIKYIVIHFTANDGDTDEGNGKYFDTANRKASAHYFVDDDSATISVPDNYVAWSVGGSRYSNYKQTGGAKLYKICTNSNSISIEMCDSLRNGVVMATEKTMQNTAELIKSLMTKYNIPISNVIRHFDVTGKYCPAYFIDQSAWNNFKSRLGQDYSTIQSTVTTPSKTPTTPQVDQSAVVRNVQTWIKTYTGLNLAITGVVDKDTKVAMNIALQKALNEIIAVYNQSHNPDLKLLSTDGDIGTNSKTMISKFGLIKFGSSGNLVKVYEAYLYLRGLNPQEFSGKFTASVKTTTNSFQATFCKPDAIVGSNTWSHVVF